MDAQLWAEHLKFKINQTYKTDKEKQQNEAILKLFY